MCQIKISLEKITIVKKVSVGEEILGHNNRHINANLLIRVDISVCGKRTDDMDLFRWNEGIGTFH